MNLNYDILDVLQEENGYVCLSLSDGSTLYGLPQCVVYDEDENGWDTVKSLMFDPYPPGYSVFLNATEIVSYERVKKEDIPKYMNRK